MVECVLQEKLFVHLSLTSAQSPHLLIKTQQTSECHDGSPKFSWVGRVEFLHVTSLANFNLNRVVGDGVHGRTFGNDDVLLRSLVPNFDFLVRLAFLKLIFNGRENILLGLEHLLLLDAFGNGGVNSFELPCLFLREPIPFL